MHRARTNRFSVLSPALKFPVIGTLIWVVISVLLGTAPATTFAQKPAATATSEAASVWNWDIATGHSTPGKGIVPQAALYAWSQEGKSRAFAFGTSIEITNSTRSLDLSTRNHGNIVALALSRNGDHLAVATSTGQLLLWADLQAAPATIEARDTSCLAFNMDGTLLASGGTSLTLWQTKDLKPLRPALPSAIPITAVAFGPAEELSAGDFAGNLHIYNSAGDISSEILAFSGAVTTLAYNIDSSLLAAGGTDGTVKLWGANRNAPLSVLGDQGQVVAIGFHPNNAVLAVSTAANQVSTWDIASRRRLRVLPLGNNTAAGLVVSANDVVQIGLQAVAPPNIATLHVLVLLGDQGAASADLARTDALAIADAIQKSGRGSFGRIDQQRLPIDTTVDASAVRDTFRSIARDSHPQDSLFVYYSGELSQAAKPSGRALTFANRSTVTQEQFAQWLIDVAAVNQTIVFDTAGAAAQEDSLRSLLASGNREQAAAHRSRLFVAFDRQAAPPSGADRAPSTAMLIDGISGQADLYPKDGKVTAAELRTFLDQRTLSNPDSGFKGKFELDGDDFAVVTKSATRGVLFASNTVPVRNESLFQRRKDYALIISTNDYEFWPKLTNPNQDADAMEAALRDQYGFQVEVLKDLTQAQIYEALTRYQKKDFQPGDQLLVFIAGHGDFDDAAREGFLVARDSKLPSVDVTRSSMIPHSRLRNYIDNIPVNHALVLLDVCFGGTFDRGIADAGARGGVYEDQPVDKLFVERAQYTTRKFITSGGKVYVPDGEPGHHSPFVNNLLTELRNPSKDRGYLTFADLLSAVGPTQPAPVWGTWGKDGAGSDFFLISRRTRSVKTIEVPRETARSESVVAIRSSICFVGLKNLSGDLSSSVWGDAITEQMTSGLGAGQKLHVVSSEDVGRLKRSLAIEDLSSYSRETLLSIRQNTGADLVIAGSFLAAKESGGLLRVSFTIQNATDGQTIDTLAVTGTQAGIDDLIGRANVLLLSKLGVSNLSAEQLAEVKAGMPTSPEAIKLYSQAMVALHRGDAQTALPLLTKADAAEPGVAFTHRGLSDVWYLLGYDNKAIAEAQTAAKLATGLPREDLYSMQARESFLSGQLPRAIDRYRYLTMTQPDNLEYGLDLARAESYAGRGKDALVNLADLVNLPPPFGGDPRVLIEQADAYKSLGDFPKVAEAARQAQLAAAERGARLLEADADWRDCFAQQNLGNSDAAVAACRQSLDIYTRVGDKLGMARSQSGLGTALAARGDYPGALAQYRMAADITASTGARTDRAGALQNIAKTQIAMHHLSDAEAPVDEMIVLAKQAGANKEERDAYFFRATIAHDKGDLDKAREFITDAMKSAEDTGDQDATARAYSFQASYGLEAGSLVSALAGADKCIEIRTRIQLRAGVAFCQQSRGDILFAQDRLPDARSAYQTSASIYTEIQQPGDAANALLSLAELDAATGSPAEGEAEARKVLLESQKEKDADLQAAALCVLLHALLVENKQADADQTWQSLQQLHPGDPDTIREVSIAEARFAAASGKVDAALAKSVQILEACGKAGLVGCTLRVRLLGSQIRLKASKIDGLDTELKTLDADASRLGFNLIATQAKAALASLPAYNAPQK